MFCNQLETVLHLAEDAFIEDIRLSFLQHGLDLVVIELAVGNLASSN
jgi:hypothetical protein